MEHEHTNEPSKQILNLGGRSLASRQHHKLEIKCRQEIEQGPPLGSGFTALNRRVRGLPQLGSFTRNALADIEADALTTKGVTNPFG